MHLPMILLCPYLFNAAEYQYLVAPPVLIVYLAARPVKWTGPLLLSHFEFAELKAHPGAVLADLTGAGAALEAVLGQLLLPEDRHVLAIQEEFGDGEGRVHCQLFVFSQSFNQIG